MVVLISDTTILPWALYVERFVEPPALFSRENRGALYVERFVERHQRGRRALCRAPSERSLYVERFVERFVERLYSARIKSIRSVQRPTGAVRRALLGAPSAKMQS